MTTEAKDEKGVKSLELETMRATFLVRASSKSTNVINSHVSRLCERAEIHEQNECSGSRD